MGEKKSLYYKVNLNSGKATLPLILVISQGILLYYCVYRMYKNLKICDNTHVQRGF
jgi:hypothetical protein